MRTTFDFTPLFRSSVGFDRMLHALEAASRVETIDNLYRGTVLRHRLAPVMPPV